jgi:cysteinyl-tRNA synthetase
MECRVVDTVLDLVGSTPLVRIRRMNPVPDVQLLVKLEYMNPGGSVKDRIALSMIEAAEKDGTLTKGKTVLEASSGNTAIGLAMVCAVRGYKLAVTMAESASEERKKVLRAYGAELILTPGDRGTDGAIEEAYRLAREYPDRFVLVDQYNNDANWMAHTRGTGPEIWEATGGQVDVVVVTMGTTGTLMGTARYLRGKNPAIRVVGVEPFKGHRLQGLKNMKESYPPGIFHPDEVADIVNVEDEPAYEAARRLAREEGILVGMSAGAAMKVALDEAARLGKGMVVALLPDSGERYLSTSLFASHKAPVPLKFWNTLTRSLQEFVPVQEGKVGIYTCGPSLDGPMSLGLARRMVFADLLRRYLEHRGFRVKHVVNLGDMDDRTVNECIKACCALKSFTKKWEDAFFRDLDSLRVLRAHHVPRASDHVGDMIEVTRSLLQKGLAYEKLRSVYFRISSFQGYGKLSRVDLNAARTASSTVYDWYEKDNPRDFALFKRSTLAELKAGLFWETPWGSARPGWHAECSTMAVRYLGQPIDIHTATADLMFPHGDNEIAISEGITGKPLANVWLHNEVVMSGGRKVTRGDNDISLRELLDKGVRASAVRFWLLASHYRKVIRFGEEELHQADQSVRRLDDLIRRLRLPGEGQTDPELNQLLFEVRLGMHEAMDEDLSTPQTIAHLFSLVRSVNRRLDADLLDRGQRDTVLTFLQDVDRVLAVMDFSEEQADESAQRLVEDRNAARAAGDYPRADEIRDELQAMGFAVQDTPAGSVITRGPGNAG